MKENKPYKIVYIWIGVFCCIAIPMFAFSEIIKQNEILTFLFVGAMGFMSLASPIVGMWFLNATRTKTMQS